MVTAANDGRRVAVRGAKLRALVLDAAIACIGNSGIDGVRVADVANAAGVHETTIYRRWKTLPRLLVDALISHITAEVPVPDTGSVREDLRAFTGDLARFSHTPTGSALIRGTVVSDTDPEVEAARREFWERRLSALQEIIQRGKDRGEVTPDTDARLVVLMLGGLVHIHATHLGSELQADVADQAVSLVLTGIAEPGHHP